MNNSTFFGLYKKSFKMELERNIRSVAIQTSNPANKNTPIENNQSQGIATLLVMLAVLTIIVLFCCFSAPGIRGLCKKYIFRSCPYDDPEVDNASTTIASDRTSPTIILLPYGRMLVVDHNLFHQLQVDQSGLDLLELSTNLINFNRNNNRERSESITPSISIFSDNSNMDNKDVSPTVSLGFDSPPLYDEIIRNLTDLPPSYSEVSLMLKKTQSPSQKKRSLCENNERKN